MIYVESGGTEVRWYGWQLLFADFGSLLLIRNVRTPVGVGLGVGGLVLGAPALHVANHNYGTAVASLAVRGGVALMIGHLAADPPPCPEDNSGCVVEHIGDAFIGAAAALGLLLGGMVFAIVDDTLLARVTVPRPARVLSPIVAPQAGGLSLGLGGNF